MKLEARNVDNTARAKFAAAGALAAAAPFAFLAMMLASLWMLAGALEAALRWAWAKVKGA